MRRFRQQLFVAQAVLVGVSVQSTLAVNAFTEEAAARGIIYGVEQRNTFGCGLAFADLDNDGDPDLVVLGRVTLGVDDTTTIGFYENDGTGHFTNRSNGSGCPPLPEATGVTAADFDGDGDLDVHITNWLAPDVLLRNDGDFQFTDVAFDMGVANLGAGSGCGWGDYDGDTWLDLYVANRTGTNNPDPPFTQSTTLNALYRNLGGANGFEDLAEQFGVDASKSGKDPSGNPLIGDRSFQGSFFDYDNDGDPDLYLSNDKGLSSQEQGPCTWRNRMWENVGGTFLDISDSSNTDGCIDAMCVALGDFDRNLYQDIYVTNLGGTGPPDTNGTNALYLNNADGTFTESGETWGVNSAAVTNPGSEIGWGAVFFDFDNDTHLELYVCNLLSNHANRLYNHDGSIPAVDIAPAFGVADSLRSYTCAVADIDNDGDLDLLVSDVPQGTTRSLPLQLYVNNEGSQRSWAKLDVIGEGGNLFAIGAQVRVRTGKTWQMREVIAGSNFKSQNELTRHFGLGAANVLDEIEVMWPGGATRTLTGYPAQQTWTLYPAARLGDADGDGTVGLDDFNAMRDCYGLTLAPGCEVFDMNGDASVDAGDIEGFLAAYDGTPEDCNDNGTADLEEILTGALADVNGDGVPDVCNPADVNQDGYVDVNDLVAIITAWGPCPGCPEDINGDNVVDVNDLVEVIVNWG